MKVYIINTKVYLLRNISQENTMAALCELIDQTFEKSPEMIQWHNRNTYKFYTFSGLTPLEKSRTYQEGTIYTFTLRTVSKELALFFKEHLVNAYTSRIKALTLETKILPEILLSKIYNLTPLVLKTDSGYWRSSLNLAEFEKRLQDNLIKKYQQIHDKKTTEDFEIFTHLKFDNLKPIATPYKKIKLLGDKLTLTLSENSMAQELGALALGTGLGEMGSRGFGYCHYKYT